MTQSLACPAAPAAALASSFNRRSALVLALGTAAGLGGCASTRIETSFKEAAFTGPPLKKLVVMGVSSQATLRRLFENTFASALTQAGVSASAGHRALPQDGPQPQEAVDKALREAGADGVVMTRMLGRDREIRRDDQMHWVPMRSMHMGMRQAWVRVYEPREIEIVRLVAETTVYRASDGLLVWSAITESAEPSNWETAIRGFAEVAIAALKKDLIL